MTPEAVRAMIKAGREKRDREARRHVRGLRHDQDPELTTAVKRDLKALDSARLKLAAKQSMLKELRRKGASPLQRRPLRGEIIAVMAEIRDLEAGVDRARRAQMDEQWRASSSAETVALEQGRGEEVDIDTAAATKGRVKIRSRDGLAWMLEAGKITREQHAAGMRYRSAYEKLHAGEIGSHLGQRDQVQHRPEQPDEARQSRRTLAAAEVARMEARVAPGRERLALQLVAGEGRRVSHFATGGENRAAYARALIRALARLS